MTTPATEIPEPDWANYQSTGANPAASHSNYNGASMSSDEEGTVFGEHAAQHQASHDKNSHPNLEVNIGDANVHGRPRAGSILKMASPSNTREQTTRLDDDLRLLQIERQISHEASREREDGKSLQRERSRRREVIDEFDVATNPLHESAKAYAPPENPSTGFAKFWSTIHHSSFIVRYFTYIVPVLALLLIPLFIGIFLPVAQGANVGGIDLTWFSVWLITIWLTLWAGRVLAKCLPWPIGMAASLFTNNAKKWRDMGKQLEIPATFFFWMLGVEISFLPTMTYHYFNDGVRPGTNPPQRFDYSWLSPVNKVLISFLVLACLNFAAKIIIQLIAISFHLRTYADRIELNKFQINSLTKLYQFSKVKIQEQDSDFEVPSGRPGSGARTPGAIIEKTQKLTKEAFNKFGDTAGKIAGDFTGKSVMDSSHPAQVTLSLLGSVGASQVLARRLYRTFARPETETVHQEDLNNAFENQEEADAAFSMFDKDMNGDITMEELEAVCVEIGRERKSITASLKDLDSVVSKLDDCFLFVVVVISILVLISLISTAASGVLTSAGSTVLALSWLFSTTAQEFLQSIIFVFVKHPFDVGDRVTIYGNAGSEMKGDDYFVKEISLLYTEFKKMEGHIVQAPNSYLNTLFILNMRRSGGLAEAIPMVFKFGTTLEQIESLRNKLLEFVRSEKREYQGNILTELRDITEAHSVKLNIIFFFKSNWQNELLRLQRRNKFFCALMIAIQECGIEGPRARYPGQKESFPMYMQHLPYNAAMAGKGGTPDNPNGAFDQAPFVPGEMHNTEESDRQSTHRSVSSSIGGRNRGESLSRLGKRFDFTLGMASVAEDPTADVFESREKPKIPINITSPSPSPAPGPRSSTSTDFGPRVTSRASTFSPESMRRTTGSVHRNRFFGRRSADEHNIAAAERGMAGISGSAPPRVDPRTGMVSPAAVLNSSNDVSSFPSLAQTESMDHAKAK